MKQEKRYILMMNDGLSSVTFTFTCAFGSRSVPPSRWPHASSAPGQEFTGNQYNPVQEGTA